MLFQKINTIFFGTHNFAAEILQGMIDIGLFDIGLVITQPDKPVGRKQEMQKPAVKILAEKYGLKIEQPKKLLDFGLRLPAEVVGTSDFDIGIVAQYGLLIPQKILDVPKYGILNVHASLLPKYRGASPIQTALLNGETETGVTIMKMDAGVDTGHILAQKTVKIEPDDTFTTLSQKLAKVAILALTEAISKYVSGKLIPTPQDNSKATFCKKLSRENGRIDWNKSAQEIYNQYRGLTPWPGIWTMWNKKRLKLLKIKPNGLQITERRMQNDNNKLFIGCKNGTIEVFELQLEGKKAMSTLEFLRGNKIDRSILV